LIHSPNPKNQAVKQSSHQTSSNHHPSTTMKTAVLLLALLDTTVHSLVAPSARSTRLAPLYAFEPPSDYDAQDLSPTEKSVTVTYDDDDEAIRDALKRELLLLSSVTNRGEYTSSEERDIVIDIVTQLGMSFI
jgi:hypothetical protein